MIIFGSAIVTVGATVYPIPGLTGLIDDNLAFPVSITAVAIAVVPAPLDPATVTVGSVV